MNKFLHDILRDKESTKFSITKFLALVFTFILVGYIIYITIIGGNYDQFLILQLLGAILTLTGFKNSFGVTKLQKNNENQTKIDFKSEPKHNDEALF